MIKFQAIEEENRKLQRVIDEMKSRPESSRLVTAALLAAEAGDDGPITAATQLDTRGGTGKFCRHRMSNQHVAIHTK